MWLPAIGVLRGSSPFPPAALLPGRAPPLLITGWTLLVTGVLSSLPASPASAPPPIPTPRETAGPSLGTASVPPTLAVGFSINRPDFSSRPSPLPSAAPSSRPGNSPNSTAGIRLPCFSLSPPAAAPPGWLPPFGSRGGDREGERTRTDGGWAVDGSCRWEGAMEAVRVSVPSSSCCAVLLIGEPGGPRVPRGGTHARVLSAEGGEEEGGGAAAGAGGEA